MALSHEKLGSRSLGPHETFFHHLSSKYNSCIYIHLAVINSSHQLAPEDVKKAFMILAEQQEALRMRIVPGEDEHLSYKFSLMDDPSLMNLRVVQLRKKSDWPNVINEESRTQFNSYHGPLWRVVMANVDEVEEDDNGDGDIFQCILFLILHHSVSDGTSGFDTLYRQFLPVLSALVNKADTNFLPYLQLTPCTEKLFGLENYKNSTKTIVPFWDEVSLDLLRWKSRNFGDTYVYERNFCFPDDPKRNSVDILKEPICKPFVFNKEFTSCIINAAKARAVTVHSVLLAVSSLALCATAEEAEVDLPKIIKQSWPVNLRKHLGLTTPQPLALHICLGHTETIRKAEYSVEGFWKMCGKIHKGVKQQSSKEFAKSWLANTQYILNESKQSRLFVILTESGGTSLTGISNVGICDSIQPTLTQGEVKLDMTEQYFSVPGLRHLHEQPFFHSVSTFKGKMTWNVTYDTNIISQQFINRYLEKIEFFFLKFCKSGE